MVDAIDRGEEELFLQVRKGEEVFFVLVGFYGGVLCDDARAGAGRVEENAVEAADDAREGARVVGGNDGVAAAEAVQVADQGAGAGAGGVVGEEDA